jgi:DNA polymerase-3 subunit gamma/tau
MPEEKKRDEVIAPAHAKKENSSETKIQKQDQQQENTSKPQNSVIQGSKTLSVKEVLSKGVMEPDPAPTGRDNSLMVDTGTDLPQESLTQENLAKVWSEFASQIKKDSSRISAQLTEVPPELSEGEKIVVRLSNAALKEEFDRRYKTALTDYLHKRLHSHNISLESRLESVEQSDTSFYTDEQKFDYLAGKNPALKDLKRNLNLDFE